MASFFIRIFPLLATITGSTTSGTPCASAGEIASATASMISAEWSIPVLMAATGKASSTSRIWSATRPGGIGVMLSTRPGCSATTQVTAVVP